ncbi:hypothetical protein SAMN02910292_03037 [Lachnospiraceae bacterium XBB2008]|nr:hypothetical protein SAMN02910292_03037 [Lachnospiraceae bacterium XBB2008]
MKDFEDLLIDCNNDEEIVKNYQKKAENNNSVFLNEDREKCFVSLNCVKMKFDDKDIEKEYLGNEIKFDDKDIEKEYLGNEIKLITLETVKDIISISRWIVDNKPQIKEIYFYLDAIMFFSDKLTIMLMEHTMRWFFVNKSVFVTICHKQYIDSNRKKIADYIANGGIRGKAIRCGFAWAKADHTEIKQGTPVFISFLENGIVPNSIEEYDKYFFAQDGRIRAFCKEGEDSKIVRIRAFCKEGEDSKIVRIRAFCKEGEDSKIVTECYRLLKKYPINKTDIRYIYSVIGELIGNGHEHGNTDTCFLDIDITDKATSRDGSIPTIAVNVVVYNFSNNLLWHALERKINRTDLVEEQARIANAIKQARENHEERFDEQYTKDDFSNISMFQGLSCRDSSRPDGGVGLSKLMEVLNHTSGNLCFVLTGHNAIVFNKDYIERKDGFIGFNEKHEYIEDIPIIDDNILHTEFYMPGVAYNFSFNLIKGE